MQLDCDVAVGELREPEGGQSWKMRMCLDPDARTTARPPMQLDSPPSDAGAMPAGRAASARVAKKARRAASAPTAKVAVSAPRAKVAKTQAATALKDARGCFQGRLGAEYAKHLAFRRDWALVLPYGKWARHDGLQGVPLTGLNAREVDLLHILWLVLEEKGYNPKEVDQAWLLCQSIHRQGGPYPRHWFRGRLPGTPGFHIGDSKAAASAVAPCVLPRGKLWLNALRRLASAGEVLQLQGVNVPSSIPWWTHTDATVLKSIAGNAFTVTVVACHCAVALLALASGGAIPSMLAEVAEGGEKGDASLPDFTVLAQRIYCQLSSS